MLLPNNVSTGRVTGQFIVGVVDGDDADQEPEVIPASGMITFTASVPYLPNLGSVPNPKTILTKSIFGVLDDQGYLCTPKPGTKEPSYQGVRLVATDDPDLSVLNWTWSAVYKFDTIEGFTPNIAPHSFALLSGETIDLTAVIKVPSSQGMGTLQAEALVIAAQSAAVDAANEAADAADSAQAAADSAFAAATSLGASNTLIDTRIDAKLIRILLPDGTDLNAMNTAADVGTYAVGSTVVNGPPIALPSTGTLEIVKGSNFGVTQRITAGTVVWFREVISVTAGTWFAWTQVSTLDTNSKVPVANLPAATSSVAGTMSSTDKAKLDAATSSSAAVGNENKLLMRDASGYFGVPTPTTSSNPTRKDYVDAADALKLDISANRAQQTTVHPVTDPPSAFPLGISYFGAGAADGYPVGLCTVMTLRNAVSRSYQTATGKILGDVWVRSETDVPVADSWTAWNRQATTTEATGSAAGLMSAADKAKLDAATSAATPNTLAIRNATGQLIVVDPITGSHAATKGYVDGALRTQMITAVPAGNAPSTYPAGVTYSQVTADSTWPTNTGSVMTVRFGSSRSFQMVVSKITGVTWIRSEDTDTWGGFTQLATTAAATASVAGLMSAADKSKLDAATASATDGTLVTRYNGGETNFKGVYLSAAPTSASHATRKDYVDAMVWDGSDITTGIISDARIANATSVLDGLMPKADKAKLDAAVGGATGSTLAMRYSDGRLGVATPTGTGDATTKGYVDAMVWDGSDITTGTISDARIAKATAALDGLMLKTDKAKLDAATSAPTVSTIAMRNSAGRIQVTDPASDTTAATPKSYVDGAISPLPLGLVGYTNAVSVTGAQNTVEAMMLEKTINVVAGRNYDIRWDMDFYGETAGDIALTVNVITGGTAATGTIIDTKTVWGTPVIGSTGAVSVQLITKYTATATASLRFAYTTNRASGSGNYRVLGRKLAILDTGAAI